MKAETLLRQNCQIKVLAITDLILSIADTGVGMG